MDRILLPIANMLPMLVVILGGSKLEFKTYTASDIPVLDKRYSIKKQNKNKIIEDVIKQTKRKTMRNSHTN